MDEEVFVTKNRYKTDFELVASGETFILPNPRDNKSFEALGDLVESLMAHIARSQTTTRPVMSTTNPSRTTRSKTYHNCSVSCEHLLSPATESQRSIANWREMTRNC